MTVDLYRKLVIHAWITSGLATNRELKLDSTSLSFSARIAADP